MTIVTSSDGVALPPTSKTAYALADSVCAWFGLPLGSSARIPPMAWLTMNSPIIAMNQPAKTGQRWRALHIATRTVAGSRLDGSVDVWFMPLSSTGRPGGRPGGDQTLDRRTDASVGRAPPTDASQEPTGNL